MQEQNNVGLYREDGLGIFRNLSRPNIERKKKEIIRIFKNFGLSITVTTNVTCADYLDVNFDLTKYIYKPYRKPNDEPVYINRHSNHSPNIVRQIPYQSDQKFQKFLQISQYLTALSPCIKKPSPRVDLMI